MKNETNKKPLVTRHEPFTLDLLNYEIAASLSRKDLPFNRFSGRRVRQNTAKLKQMRKRDKRLRRLGLSVVAFAS